ncbi:hypothetical protein GCM10023116_47910 [Kistimonas scapharcae]|uniref:Cobalamin biosynthesis protein CobT VWA domain-containing protein n=1 Tax=Kistimonas scapharcae TaxID=1036133 RepID=A0ABP8V9S0_9GAMM
MKRKTTSMKASDFTHECRGTSRTFGRNERIDIVFRGNMAGTDGNKIIYPSLDLKSTLDENQVAVSRGYIDHETGHLRYTDMEAFQSYARQAIEAGTPFRKDIANGIEDPRMERLVMQDYEGATDNLTAVANAVCRQMLETMASDTDSPWYAFVPVTLANMGRVNNGLRGDDLSDFLGAVQARMSAGQYRMCVDWAARITGLASTQDSLALADEIFDAIVELEPGTDKPDDDAYSDTDTGDSDDAGDADSDGDGSGDSDSSGRGSQPDSDGDDDADDDGNGTGHDDSEGDNSVDTADDDTPSDGDGKPGVNDADHDDPRLKVGGTKGLRGDVTAAIKDAVADHTGDGSEYRTFSTEFDTWSDKTTDDEIGTLMRDKDNLSRYDEAVNETAGKINVMRRKLETALAARRDVRWVGSQKAGRLDPRRLVGAYNAEDDVYRFREEDNDVETAVTVLVDLSTSMIRNGKNTIAMQSVIAIAEALEKTHVQYEILGFCTNRHSTATVKLRSSMDAYMRRDDYDTRHPRGFNFTRFEAINMAIFKAFNQPLNLCRTSLVAVERVPCKSYVCNCDGESLLLAYDRLRVRPEPRKVLMVLSDGAPMINGTNDRTRLARHLYSSIRDIEDDGVEVLGIGIVDSAVRNFYPRHVVVHAIKDLTTVALEQIAKILLGRRL